MEGYGTRRDHEESRLRQAAFAHPAPEVLAYHGILLHHAGKTPQAGNSLRYRAKKWRPSHAQPAIIPTRPGRVFMTFRNSVESDGMREDSRRDSSSSTKANAMIEA